MLEDPIAIKKDNLHTIDQLHSILKELEEDDIVKSHELFAIQNQINDWYQNIRQALKLPA